MAAFVAQTPFDKFVDFEEVAEGAYNLAAQMIDKRKEIENGNV